MNEFAGWSRSMFVNNVRRGERRQAMRKLPITGNMTLDDPAQAPQRELMIRRMPSYSIFAVAVLVAVAR
jgi:hypothetical protein